MTVKTRPTTIVAPDNLMPGVRALLEKAQEPRDAIANGQLILLEATEDACPDADIIIAPRPDRALEWARARRANEPFVTALASRMMSRLANAAASPKVSVIYEEEVETTSADALRVISQKILSRKGFASPTGRLSGPPAWSRSEPPLKAHTLEVFNTLPTPEGTRATWPHEIFLAGDGPCPFAIDIMGRARILFYGPYIALPDGVWQAHLMFDISERAMPYDYLVEFGTIGRFSRMTFRAEKPGLQCVNIQHVAKDALPMEVRFFLLRAAFVGDIKFGGCVVKKLS
jgi:hypothetical protein